MGEMSPYGILGLAADCTPAQVQAAWAKALKESRRNGAYTPEEVNDARETLLNPTKRAAYAVEHFPEPSELEWRPVQPVTRPALAWLEHNCKWAWAVDESCLRGMAPPIPVPDIVELRAKFPQFIAKPALEPVVAWLSEYSGEVDDPWSM